MQVGMYVGRHVDITTTIATLFLFLLYYLLAAFHFGAFWHMLGGVPIKVPMS